MYQFIPTQLTQYSFLLLFRWFERAILFLIVMNCGFLSIYDPLETPTGFFEFSLSRNKILEYSELFFTFAFTIEMILRIFAQGFLFHKYSYLRDAWNVLDYVIVQSG